MGMTVASIFLVAGASVTWSILGLARGPPQRTLSSPILAWHLFSPHTSAFFLELLKKASPHDNVNPTTEPSPYAVVKTPAPNRGQEQRPGAFPGGSGPGGKSTAPFLLPLVRELVRIPGFWRPLEICTAPSHDALRTAGPYPGNRMVWKGTFDRQSCWHGCPGHSLWGLFSIGPLTWECMPACGTCLQLLQRPT